MTGILRALIGAAAFFLSAVLATGAALVWHLEPGLPALDTLRTAPLAQPLRIYTREGLPLAEFGRERRLPVRYGELPLPLIQAVLAAEDDRFFEHPGVDWRGLLRAALNLAATGEKRQGGSTITMQLARNYFLGAEKTYLRKMREILLALRIERALSKTAILELYLNRIYFGHHAYGIAAAAEVYYGRALDALTLPQIAMLAGLPKAPSSANPLTAPAHALARRNYVLARMHRLGYLDAQRYERARATPDDAHAHTVTAATQAPHAAELVRDWAARRWGAAAYTLGLRIVTTLSAGLQRAATASLRESLHRYDQRHGYRGPVARLEARQLAEPAALNKALLAVSASAGLVPVAVMAVDEKAIHGRGADGAMRRVDWPGLDWARRQIDADRQGPTPQRAADIVQVGDVVYLRSTDAGWMLAQRPAIEGALVALEADSGAALALVGGYDFAASKFNRATQARRQPGSALKPFLYSAALEHGYTPASLVDDAPLAIETPTGLWRPENYGGGFRGPMRLRSALAQSRNLVSVRLLQAVGIDTAVRHARRFGLPETALPALPSLALGTGSVSPMELAAAYAVFANGGFRVGSHLIERVEDANGTVLYAAPRRRLCMECTPVGETARTDPTSAPRVLSTQQAWLMTSMLREVIDSGTGRAARALGRRDLAGKTGTTNDERDAWFAGYQRDLVAVSWMGFDRHAPLGAEETGGRAALPMWMDFMRAALAGVPERESVPPPGIVTLRIDPATGLQATAGARGSVLESFAEDRVPDRGATSAARSALKVEPLAERLF